MAARELLRRPRAFVVPAGILVLLALLLLYPSAILDGLSDQTTGALRNTPADLIVYSEDAKSSLLRSRVDAATRATIEGVDGVGEVSGFDVIMLGATVDHRQEPLGLAVMASERALGPSVPGPGEAYVDASLREDGIREGDELAVGPFATPVTVVGFTNDRNLFFQAGMIVDRATWRAALDPTGGALTPEQSATTPPSGATDPAALPSAPPEGSSAPGATGTTVPGGPTTGTGGEGTTGDTVPGGSATTSLPAGPAAGGTATDPAAPDPAAGGTGTGPAATTGGTGGTGETGEAATGGTTATGPEMAAGGPASAAAPGQGPGAEGTAPAEGGREDAAAQTLLLTVDAGADLDAVAAAVDEATGGETNTITPAEAVRSLPGTETQATTFGAIRGVTLAVALVVVGLFLSFVTLERTPLYAVLKALGMSSRQLFTGVVVQVLIVTVSASLVAAAATWGLTHIPLDLPTVMRPERFAETVIALTVTSVVGSVLSLRRVARVDPASAIG